MSITLPQTFSALGDKTRFKLFQMLAANDAICVSQLAEELNISPACVSQHMKVLAEAKLVNRVRNGQRVCYEVDFGSSQNKILGQLIFNKKEA
jgi:ArsR family transcriptional regulator, arsenate/arsenite/antimonite-responsive transcriptional repressor